MVLRFQSCKLGWSKTTQYRNTVEGFSWNRQQLRERENTEKPTLCLIHDVAVVTVIVCSSTIVRSEHRCTAQHLACVQLNTASTTKASKRPDPIPGNRCSIFFLFLESVSLPFLVYFSFVVGN
mmetsp:Transcript_8381/g.17436  ORF Transcript_8381/g.17436 Transcript_8381/m.17436 type:complete len:123 (-) Transcript_8381:979-1347(-)